MTTHTSTGDLQVVLPEARGPEEQAAAFVERVFGSGLAAVELLTVDLGRRLGLYAPLRGSALTPGELGARRGIAPRYAREWLEQQAAAGIVHCENPTAAPHQRRFTLPEPHAWCLLDQEHPSFIAAFSAFPAICAAVLPDLEQAFRNGTGVPYGDYHLHRAQGEQNRPVFFNELRGWLETVPGLVDRLESEGARVAEFGCGEGWASVYLAEQFPQVQVDAFDVDLPSLADARNTAADRGLSDRVRFTQADVTAAGFGQSGYDLVFAVEMLHDLARPVEALSAMRRMAGDRGVVLVVDEKVGERFTAPADELDRVFYAFSVLHCLPVGMTRPDSAATGTVMRPDTLRQYATKAGFTRVEDVELDNPFFRGYRLLV